MNKYDSFLKAHTLHPLSGVSQSNLKLFDVASCFSALLSIDGGGKSTVTNWTRRKVKDGASFLALVITIFFKSSYF